MSVKIKIYADGKGNLDMDTSGSDCSNAEIVNALVTALGGTIVLAAKDGHTDGPVDGEEKQLKIDGGETPAAEKAPAEPPEPPKPPAEPATPKYTPTFDEFWDAYPKKAEKGNAFKKYQARIHEGFSPEELLMAARNYATQCKRLGTEKQYIKHPKTFLSDSRPFLDYLPDKKKAQPPEDAVPDNKNPFAEYGEE